MEREDGEMSDDNDNMVVDDYVTESIEDNEASTVLYRTEKNGLVIKKLEKVDAIKLEERARRFGLDLTGNRVITQKQIDDLYENFGIESGNERHFRFDSIHLSGIDGLTTREIFQYLEDYKPLSLEWIDNISCNVVCQDHISAALALLAHSREIKNEDLKKMLAEKSNHHWREGIPHPRKDLIVMRFATNGDKKIAKKKHETKNYSDYDHDFDSVSKNPWGDLCKSWGVYDHQEVFETKYTKHDFEDDIEEPEIIVPIKNKKLALRLGKRPHKVNDSNDMDDDSNSDSEWKTKSKTPRMRMHADDEEKKQKQKYVSQLPKEEEYTDKFAPLSIEVANNKTNYYPHRDTTRLSDKFKYHNKTDKIQSIQSRLGEKIGPENDAWSSDDSSNNDYNLMSKVQKVHSKIKDNNSIWSRLEDVPCSTGGGGGSDLRHIIKSKKQNKSDDLRERIGKTKQSNLRIEIDNN